jgi:hypothetical protein
LLRLGVVLDLRLVRRRPGYKAEALAKRVPDEAGPKAEETARDKREPYIVCEHPPSLCFFSRAGRSSVKPV